MTIRNLMSRSLKMIACAAVAATLLALLIGATSAACNAAPLQDGSAEESGAIVVTDLSAIEDGYDAASSSIAYLVAIPEF